jgi:hypothetical protein
MKITKEEEEKICQSYLKLRSSGLVSLEFKRTRSVICKVLKRNNIKVKTREESKTLYSLNHDFFNKIDTPEKAYILGLIFSDGSVTDRALKISLQITDINILEKVKNIMEYTGNVKIYKSKKPNVKDSAILQIYSKKLIKDLNNLGCVKNKTYSLEYPIISNFNSHFIRGVFDGDGCITNFKKSYYFSITGRIVFLEKLQDILIKEVQINKSKISKKNHNSNIFGAIQYSKRKTLLSLRDYLYKESNNLFIERKKNKFFEILEVTSNECKICNKPNYSKGLCKNCYMKQYRSK